MIHPAHWGSRPRTHCNARLATFLTALLLLAGIPPASAATGGDPQARAAVLIFLDDSDYHWADVGLGTDPSALCATVSACGQLGIALNYSMSQWGAFVTGIGGLKAPEDFSWWWYLLLWNGTKGAWQEAPVGAGDLRLSAGDSICWCPNSSAPPVPNPVTRYPWPCFRGNLKNSGIAPGNTTVLDDLKWTADLANGPVDTTPAIAGGRVFVSTGGIYNWTTMSYDQPPHLYALNATTGERLWSAQTSAAGWQVSSPAVRNGRVIVGTSDGKVLAFSVETGTPLWSFSTGPSPTGVTASPVVTAGAIHIAAGDGNLYAISHDGKQMWSFPLGGPAYMSTPALWDGKLFAGTDNGTFWCLGLNGTPVWNLTVDGKIRCSPVIASGKVYIIATIYEGWNAKRSLLHLRYCTNGSQSSAPVVLPATTSSPVVFGGQIYVGDNSGLRVYMADGAQIRVTPTEGPVQASPVIHGGELFFLENSCNGTLHVIGADTRGENSGRAFWNFTPEPRQYILGSPAITDGFLFFGSDNGRVYCLGGPGADATGPSGERQPFQASAAFIATGLLMVAVLAVAVVARRRRGARGPR